jgi:hypothetical protein
MLTSAVVADEPDVVADALRLVRHLVHVGFGAADAHALALQPLGGPRELFRVLNLEHLFRLR